MNSVCKDKILRSEVHPVVKKIITIHCTVVTWERKREIKETSNFYWKGLKKPLDTVLLMAVTPVKYLSGHKEGPSNDDGYNSTKAGKQVLWEGSGST